MLDGSLWIVYNDSCTITDNVTPIKKQTLEYVIPILIFSFIALCLNTICMTIFARQHRKSVMRTSLLILSITEVFFHAFVCIDYSMQLTLNSDTQRNRTVAEYVLIAIIIWGSDCFLCTRNWCNVLITAARTEVVVYPMRKHRFLFQTSITIIYGFIWILSGFLGAVRAFYDYVIVCVNKNSKLNDQIIFTQLQPFLSEMVITNFEAYCFFIFQVILPIFLVLIMSFIIAFYVSPWRDSKVLEVTNVRRRHQMKATRTILFLAISFLCFQTPSFILVIFQHYTNFMSGKKNKNFEIARLVADLLLISDSIINILIYAIGLPGFRQYLHRLIICKYYFCNYLFSCKTDHNNHSNHDHHHHHSFDRHRHHHHHHYHQNINHTIIDNININSINNINDNNNNNNNNNNEDDDDDEDDNGTINNYEYNTGSQSIIQINSFKNKHLKQNT